MMQPSFFNYAQAIYNKRYDAEEIAYHTWYNGTKMLGMFQVFCQETLHRSGVTPGEIDESLLFSYRRFCLEEKGNSLVTVNRKLAPICQVLKVAQAEGLYSPLSAESLKSAFCQRTPRRYGPEASRFQKEGGEAVRYLSDAQLKSLVSYYNSLKDSYVRDSLDLFFFSFHACGLRVSDIVTLEWSHILLDHCRLRKVMVKSKKRLEIPLSEAAIQILRRWKERQPEGRFVFGLLPDDMNLEADAEMARAIDNVNRTVGRRLNAVGRHLSFPFPLGMHVARHTFAVKPLNSARLDVHLISHLLGHSSVLVTEKVYAKLLLPSLSKELNEKLSFLEYGIEK